MSVSTHRTSIVASLLTRCLTVLFGLSFGTAVLAATEAVEAMIKTIARAHTRSAFVRAALIPLFVTLFSLGGATFGMSEEAIPFVLIFVPLALALGYDSITGVSIPFLGSQVGFSAAFLNPFNVGIAQGIAGVPIFSGIGYRLIVWSIATTVMVTLGVMLGRVLGNVVGKRAEIVVGIVLILVGATILYEHLSAV